MVSKTEVQKFGGDTFKYFLTLAFAVGAIAGFYYFAEQSFLYRVIGMLVVFGVAIAIFYTTTVGYQLWGFFQASRTEVRKVVWPTRTETTQTTLIVFVIVFLVGLFLYLLDMFFGFGFRWITGIG